MKPVRYFPIRLFVWIFVRQTFYLTGAFIIFGYFAGYLLQSLPMSNWSLFLSALALGLGLTISVSAILLRRLLVPLGRLIEKTKRLREFPFDEEKEQLDFGQDDPGEWFELDRALNLLGQSLRQKTIQLSREKTELRAIMSSISEAVLAVSENHQVLFYNAQLANIFDIKTGVVDEKVSTILRHPEVLEAYDSSLNSGEAVRIEISLPVKGQEHKEYVLSVSPLKKAHNNETYGAVGLFYDITKLKAAEKVRIEFVGNVSHELRTPLTSISGYLQTVIQDFQAQRYSEAKEFLNIIEKNVNRLKSLVADLLDLSNLESGQELRKDWLSTEELTETVLKQFGVHNREIKVEILEGSVYGDPDRLAQVLRNLLENAIRYVPVGKDIMVKWFSVSDNEVILKVIDNGPGIAPEHQLRLFERFYRVDQSRARVDGGTGIGLSLVKHIVQRHGGRVDVKSQLGHGSEFTCVFPNPPA